MTDRKGVLVRFPPDLLADLDAEARRTGRSRHDMILARCRRESRAPDQPSVGRTIEAAVKAKRARVVAPTAPYGPPPVVPGSRLKKR